ncbi:uncharacterized protein LOC144196693 [Stigmatopora nigra]
MFSDEGSSIAFPNQSFLEDTQRNFSQIDILPEDKDSDLEMTLRSQGSNLSELYPSMIYRIGRAQQKLQTSRAADSVVRKYRKRLQMSSRPKNMALNHRKTLKSKPKKSPVNNWHRSPLRNQTNPVLDLSSSIESPESEQVELNKTFTVEIQQSFCPPLQSSSISLETLPEQSSKYPSVYNLTPSRSSQAYSKASIDMMERSRKLMGEEPCQFFSSPSKSSDASPGVFRGLPPKLRNHPSVSGDKQTCGVLSPSQSCDTSPRVSLDLTPRSRKRSLSSATEQPFLWTLSPSRVSNLHPDFSPKSRKNSHAVTGEHKSPWVLSSPRSSATTSDQSPLSKKTLCSSAKVPYISSGVFDASRTYDSQRPQRLFNTTAKEQPPNISLFQPSSPYLDQSPRSKRLPILTTEEQTPSRSNLTPSRASNTSSSLSLRAQRLLNATMEQQQPTPGVHSLSQDSGTPSGISLRAKRLFNTAAEEQTSRILHSPLRSPCPRPYPSVDVPKENSRFQIRPDVYDSPVRQSTSNWKSLQRSYSDRVLRYSSAPVSPLRRPLSTQKLQLNSSTQSPTKVRNRAWRHLSFDSSLASDRGTFSGKKLDEHFEKQYHKFVCRSKVFNGYRCQICERKEEASLQQSQNLVALALSTCGFKMRKRHQDSDLENPSGSKRWCNSSPGSKRHRNELLRRRLHLNDVEGPVGGVFNYSKCQEINGHAMSDDDIPTYSFPEYTQHDMNRKW